MKKSKCDFLCTVYIFGVLFILIYNPPVSSRYRVSASNILHLIDLSIHDYSIKNDEKVVILGDFNLPDFRGELTKIGPSHEYGHFSEFLFQHGYNQLVDKPTHSHGNILDLVFSNFDINVRDVDSEANLSDHFPITFSFLNDVKNVERISLDDKYSISSCQFPKLCESIASSLFSFRLSQDPVTYISNWFDDFYSLLFQSLPKKRRKRCHLPTYFSSHSVHIYNKLKSAKRANPVNNAKLKQLSTDLHDSIELDKICFIEDFVDTQTSSTSCYKLINIIKNETLLPDVMFFNGEQKVNDLEKPLIIISPHSIPISRINLLISLIEFITHLTVRYLTAKKLYGFQNKDAAQMAYQVLCMPIQLYGFLSISFNLLNVQLNMVYILLTGNTLM